LIGAIAREVSADGRAKCAKIHGEFVFTSTPIFETDVDNQDGVARRLSVVDAHTALGNSYWLMILNSHCVLEVCLQYAPKLLAHRLGTEGRYLLQYQELLAGLVRLHILHHAAVGEIYGVWIIEELARHGYRLSPGTLYPMLHTKERKGYLRSRERSSGRSIRRLYRTTALGYRALKVANAKLRKFVGEPIEGK
jgi:hypothetical protein